MADTVTRVKVPPEVIEVLRQGESDDRWLQEHLEILEPYRGEWVVVHGRRVVAHAPDGRDVARVAPASDYPGALLLYVPTREEARAVHI
jgi:hypothetical protein